VPASDFAGRLSVMVLVDALGTGLFLAGSAVAFVRFVGLTPSQLALGILLGGIISLCTAVAWGRLGDRIGPRRTLVVLSLWRAVGFAAFTQVHGFTGFVVAMCFLGVVDRAVAPATQALVGDIAGPDDRVQTLAALRALRNLGFGVAGLLAGAALSLDTRAAFDVIVLANAATFLLVAAILARLPVAHVRSLRTSGGGQRALSPDGPLLALLAINALLSVHMTLLAIGIPLLVAQHTDAPLWMVGALLTVNTVLAVAFQVRASRGASGVDGSTRCLRATGVALASSCVLLAAADLAPPAIAIGLLLGGVIALTAGELLHSAGAWELSFELAPPGRQSTYLSVFSLGVTVQLIVGPVVIVGVLAAGPAGWAALALALVLAGAVVPAVARRAHRHGYAHVAVMRPAGVTAR
jgi:MFS family permease